jgi:hypothetical protein
MISKLGLVKSFLLELAVLAPNRRHEVHFDVTGQPTALWTAEQVVQASPGRIELRCLLRDRDGIYLLHEEFPCSQIPGLSFGPKPASEISAKTYNPVLTSFAAVSSHSCREGAPSVGSHCGPSSAASGLPR